MAIKESPIAQAIFRYNSFSSYSTSKKKDLAEQYFEASLEGLEDTKRIYPLYTGRIRPTIKHPQFVSTINFLVFNFYTFLLLYSELNGRWGNFNSIIKEISFLLWDSGYGQVSYEMFQPVLNNKVWRGYYLSGCPAYKTHNYKYHKREPSADIECPVCGSMICSNNIKKHINSKYCLKAASKR
jgi:hypothetical protein